MMSFPMYPLLLLLCLAHIRGRRAQALFESARSGYRKSVNEIQADHAASFSVVTPTNAGVLASIMLTSNLGAHRPALQMQRGIRLPRVTSSEPDEVLEAEISEDRGRDKDAKILQDEVDQSTQDVALDPAVKVLPADMVSFKAQIHLLQLASGLDRGLVASDMDVSAIDTAARALEACSEVKLDFSKQEDLAKLDGRWRLVYSSAFATGTLGGSRPGPSSNGPVRFGKVVQRIDTGEQRLDNIIEPVYIVPPGPLPSSTADVSLGHALELVGTDEIRITSDGSTIQPRGLPPLDFQTANLPFINEVRSFLSSVLPNIGSSTFRVSYIGDTIYITRGDRSELRVFVREQL